MSEPTSGTDLDGAIRNARLIAYGGIRDRAAREADTWLTELERLRAIERRATYARDKASTVGEIEAATWILNGDPS